jgi:hypothetical protein
MLLKVTLKFSFYCVIILFCGCAGHDNAVSEFEMQRIKDSVSEARIDSANTAIKSKCDTLMVYQLPKMIDSLLKDSASLRQFFDTTKLYNDADEKVEKVIRQLLAECDSNLLKETYRIAQQRQKLKPKPHLKRKV